MQTIRKSGVASESFWITRLVFISLNVLLLYLLLNFKEILYVFFGLIGLILVFAIFGLILSKRKSKLSPKKSIPDQIWLAKKYIFINKKYIIATIFGLVLATTVISQTVLLSSSYKQDSLNNFLIEGDTTGLEYEIKGISDYNTFDTWANKVDSEIGDLLQKSDLVYTSSNNSFDFTIPLLQGIDEGENGDRLANVLPLKTGSIEPAIFDFFSTFPTFNNSVKSSNIDNLTIINYDDSFEFNSSKGLQVLADTDSKNSFDNSTFKTLSLSSEATWIITAVDMNFLDQKSLILNSIKSRFLKYVKDTTLLLKNNNKWPLYEKIASSTPSNTKNSFLDLTFTSTKIYFNLPDLRNINLLFYVNRLDQLENQAESWAMINGGIDFDKYELNVDSPLKSSIEDYMDFTSGYSLILYLITGMLAGIAMFVFYYSLTLIEQRKSRLLAIFKIRGSSKTELQIMMLSEMISGGIIAIVVGMILSIPWTGLFLKASGLFEFDAQSIVVNVPNDWYWRMPLIGMILSYDLTIGSILSLSKTKIDEGELYEEKKEPIWQRIYLDIVLFFLSALFWLFIKYIPIRSEDVYDLLVESVSPTMLVILIIGAPLIYARYFSGAILKISNFLWKVKSGITAIALKNLRNNRYSTSRLASLLMIGIMLSFMSVIIPYTVTDWGANSADYSMGAQMYIEGIDTKNQTQVNILSQAGVDQFSEMGKMVIPGGPNGQYTLLGINTTTFSKVAFWDTSYDQNSLGDIIKPLVNNDSIGIQTQVLKSLGLNFGDKLSISLTNGDIKQSMVFNIVTDFDYFPNLVQEIPLADQYGGYNPKDTPIVMQYSTLQSLNNISSAAKLGIYATISNTKTLKDVSTELKVKFKNNPEIVVQNVDDAKINFFEVIETKILITTLQGMLIVSILSAIIAVSFYSFISLSTRKNEFGVLRALGMVRGQIFIMLLIENIVILVSAIIVGAIAGIFISSNLTIFLTLIIQGNKQGGATPPINLMIPWTLIMQFTLILAVLSLLASIIPTLNYSMKEAGNILRED